MKSQYGYNVFMVKEHALWELQFLHMTKGEGHCSLVAWYKIDFAVEELWALTITSRSAIKTDFKSLLCCCYEWRLQIY